MTYTRNWTTTTLTDNEGNAFMAEWYQPKGASSYATLRRYSKGDHVRVWTYKKITTGAFSTSAGAPLEAPGVTGGLVTLAGASTLLASAVTLGAVALAL